MKTPLHYQMTEYDCGPISMMNAIIFLFDREQIPPDLIRNIMLYCLDGYGAEGAPGRSGTMQFTASSSKLRTCAIVSVSSSSWRDTFSR